MLALNLIAYQNDDRVTGVTATPGVTTTVSIDFTNLTGTDNVVSCVPAAFGVYKSGLTLGVPSISGNVVTLAITNNLNLGQSSTVRFQVGLVSSAQIARSVKIICSVL